MDKKRMLERIYEVIADKTLSFGCLLEGVRYVTPTINGKNYIEQPARLVFAKADGNISSKRDSNRNVHTPPVTFSAESNGKIVLESGGNVVKYQQGDQGIGRINERVKSIKVKGHPVMIGDVLQHFKKEIWYGEEDLGATFETVDGWLDFNEFFALREDKRRPIDDQSDECIKFVYDLLPKE